MRVLLRVLDPISLIVYRMTLLKGGHDRLAYVACGLSSIVILVMPIPAEMGMLYFMTNLESRPCV